MLRRMSHGEEFPFSQRTGHDKMRKRFLCALCAMIAMLPGCAAAESFASTTVLEIERALYSLGYHSEKFDGLLDDETCGALRSFQTANGLAVTGVPDAETVQLLNAGTGVTCHEYLVAMKEEYAGLPILQSGSAGEAVGRLQRSLKALGYFSGECDGVFGDETLAAVTRFQMANGLNETGAADRATQLRLNEGEPLAWQAFLEASVAAFGESGTQVRLLQRKLKALGYFDGACSGSYGELTQQAVFRFQGENGLEKSGVADLSTCAALYSGRAAPLRDPGTLRMGDDGDAVSKLQSDLAACGYFDRNVTGVFGATTEIAVRLFRLANGLPVGGEADAQLLARLESGSAAALTEEMHEQLRLQMDGAGEEERTAIAATALQLRGRSFEADDEDLYRGFAFVQYVCLAANVPVTEPEELLKRIADPVERYDEPEAGDILMFVGSDSVLLAVSSGNGSAVYATAQSGYVLESDLRSLNTGELYRWSMETLP